MVLKVATIALFLSLALFLPTLFTLIIAIKDLGATVTENILEILHKVIVVVDQLVVASPLICNLLRLDTPFKSHLCCT